MQEFNFTPGPWFEHREGFSTVYVEAKLRDGVIQEVAACGPTEMGSAQQSANARLIATAPELLDFIIEYKEAWDDGLAGDSYLLRKAEKVIAKALGK